MKVPIRQHRGGCSKERVVIAVVTALALLVPATASLADPDLTNVPRHRHWIEQPDGTRVQVGPRFCDNPDLQEAFNQFHNNLHIATPSSIGPAAPGLHNGMGAEIKATPC